MACPVASPCFSAKWIPPAVTGETIPAASPTSSTRRAAAGLTTPPQGIRPARTACGACVNGNSGAILRRNAAIEAFKPAETPGRRRRARPTCKTPTPWTTQPMYPGISLRSMKQCRRSCSGGSEVDRGHVGCVQAHPVHAPYHLGRQAVEERKLLDEVANQYPRGMQVDARVMLALEHCDPLAGAGKGSRAGETRETRPDDDSVLLHWPGPPPGFPVDSPGEHLTLHERSYRRHERTDTTC